MRRQVGEPGIEQLLGGRAGRAYDDLAEVLAMAVVRVLEGALEVAAVQLEGGERNAASGTRRCSPPAWLTTTKSRWSGTS